MQYFFIINPGSKQQRGAHFIPVLTAELDRLRIDYQYKLTTSLEDAYILSKTANENGYDVIVAIGGDGTINKVINGFYDANGKKISKAKLGVIHTGTSPDFCKSYGIPVKPSLALLTLLKGYSKMISVAEIEYLTQTGASQRGYFACCASLGVGAQVAKRSNSGIRKYLGDTLGTFVSILISLSTYKPTDLKITCDSRGALIGKNFNTFIGKTTFIASGMKVSHPLACDDNSLYVLSMKRLNLLNIIPAIKTIYSGEQFINKDYISISYATTIEVSKGEANNEIEFDGDPQGFLPCRIAIAQDKLELITDEL